MTPFHNRRTAMTHTLKTLLAGALLATLPAFAEDASPAEKAAEAASSDTAKATETVSAENKAAETTPLAEPAATYPAIPQPENYHLALVGPDGKTATDADAPFKDKYLLVAFGFTSCPDVCPTTLYEFAQMLKIVKTPEQIQPVFISIDPLRDDPERLNQYTGFFDKRIVGLTGNMDDIEATAKRYGASFGYRHKGKKVVPPDLPNGYTVYHSTIIYLLSPKRELIDAFDYQSGAEKLARDIEKAIAKDEGAKS